MTPKEELFIWVLFLKGVSIEQLSAAYGRTENEVEQALRNRLQKVNETLEMELNR